MAHYTPYDKAFLPFNINPGRARYDMTQIRPEKEAVSVPYILVIDSANRDTATNSPENYTVTLKKQYNDVTSIELIQSHVPNSNYNITSYHNTVHISASAVGPAVAAPDINDGDGNPLLTSGTAATVTAGYYVLDESGSASDLASALETAIATAVSATVVIDIDNTYTLGCTNKVRISSDRAFSLYFNGGIDGTSADEEGRTRYYRSGSIGELLGFMPKNYQSSYNSSTGYHVIVSDYGYNIELDRYVMLKIFGIERCDSTNGKLSGCFSCVPLDTTRNDFNLVQGVNCVNNDSHIYHFPTPCKLTQLKIEFRDTEGNLYDFRGINHVLTFRIHSLARNKYLK